MAVVVALILFGVVGRVGATDIETADGRHFSNCSVLKADGLGIYFRHSTGIARVLYQDLSDELLAALGPLPEEDLKVSAPRSASEIQAAHKGAQGRDVLERVVDADQGSSIGALQLQFWQRVTYGVPETITRSQPCCWPQGSRFTGVHRYSRFPCRQLAELDFLITTGILPRPAGVVTRRISHRNRMNYRY